MTFAFREYRDDMVAVFTYHLDEGFDFIQACVHASGETFFVNLGLNTAMWHFYSPSQPLQDWSYESPIEFLSIAFAALTDPLKATVFAFDLIRKLEKIRTQIEAASNLERRWSNEGELEAWLFQQDMVFS